jgi:hypothetical protein
MNDEEMLRALGLSASQLQDLLQKFRKFLQSLDEQQRQVVMRSLPTLTEGVNAFGGNANESDLVRLFEGDEQHPPVLCIFPGQHNRNR